MPEHPVNVQELTEHGFMLVVGSGVWSLPYAQYPWFRGATEKQLQNVELSGGHLYWPGLDVDLSLDTLRNPDAYPLISRVMPGSEE